MCKNLKFKANPHSVALSTASSKFRRVSFLSDEVWVPQCGGTKYEKNWLYCGDGCGGGLHQRISDAALGTFLFAAWNLGEAVLGIMYVISTI